jgi:hypothetical protein
MNWVPICGRCGSAFVNHAAYEATPGYGGSATGCQNCSPSIKSDAQRRVAVLEALEATATAHRAFLEAMLTPEAIEKLDAAERQSLEEFLSGPVARGA